MHTMDVTFANHVNEHMRDCFEDCLRCHEAVTQYIVHGPSRSGAHAEASHMMLLMDCAEICRTSADFMQRGSELHHFTCGVCSKICERCADACNQIEAKDEYMQRCVEACRRCAESCRQMASHHASDQEHADIHRPALH